MSKDSIFLQVSCQIFVNRLAPLESQGCHSIDADIHNDFTSLTHQTSRQNGFFIHRSSLRSLRGRLAHHPSCLPCFLCSEHCTSPIARDRHRRTQSWCTAERSRCIPVDDGSRVASAKKFADAATSHRDFGNRPLKKELAAIRC
jgi:hypothetical protein